MDVRRVSSAQALDALARRLGLNSDDEIALSSSCLRRSASLTAPVSRRALVDSVVELLDPLRPTQRVVVGETLDRIVASGDLVEVLEGSGERRTRTVYLGAPRYVCLPKSGDVVLVGTRPDGLPLLRFESTAHVQTFEHIRRIRSADEEFLDLLAADGFIETTSSKWLDAPEQETAESVRDLYIRAMESAPPSGLIEELKILDPKTSPAHYRSRWRASAAEDNGPFVARRNQAYGADLWCLVQLRDGEAQRFVDLPRLSSRGCDEAWRLQAAFDALNDQAQELRVEFTGQGSVLIGVPAPLPGWLQRRWDLIGTAVRCGPGLFNYLFRGADARDEIAFAQNQLWMERVIVPTQREDSESG